MTTSEGGERGEEDREIIDAGLAAGGSVRCTLVTLWPIPVPDPLLSAVVLVGLGTLNGVPLPFGNCCRGVTGEDWPDSCALPSCSNLVRSDDMGLIDVVSGPSLFSAIMNVL